MTKRTRQIVTYVMRYPFDARIAGDEEINDRHYPEAKLWIFA